MFVTLMFFLIFLFFFFFFFAFPSLISSVLFFYLFQLIMLPRTFTYQLEILKLAKYEISQSLKDPRMRSSKYP